MASSGWVGFQYTGVEGNFPGFDCGSSRSVFADKLVDAALKPPFFLLAPAQPRVKVGDRQLGFRAERNADEVVAPPDDPGEERAAFTRDGHRHLLFMELNSGAEFDLGALVGDVVDDAIPGRAIVADLGDPAIDNLVARALASIQHRMHSPKRRGPYAALPHAKGRNRQKAALT